jgi:hypothetical protein
MNNSPAEQIARAVLYEGYILYPYRASAIKNRQRWTFGGLAPGSALRTECLVIGEANALVEVKLRFLHLFERIREGSPPWQEAVEREAPVPPTRLADLPRLESFHFSGQHSVEGSIELRAERIGDRLFRLTASVRNFTPCDGELSQDEIALRTLISAHVALQIGGGEFVSLTDPPDELRSAADACRNDGVWPVLVGEDGSRDAMLASPIILPDYPRIAPESTGDFFDGTEIDEMLALRVLTLTDSEKKEMAEGDGRAKAILDRVETMSEDRRRGLHGVVRSEGPRPGERVRLRPRGRADAFDRLLHGKTATIVSVEVDFEGTAYFAVTIDEDPGGDLGAAGKIGHRFFFRPEEVERL